MRALYGAGKTATAITEKLGLSRERVERLIRLEALPPRNVMATSTSSPGYFLEHLTQRWQEGCTMATRQGDVLRLNQRHLADIAQREAATCRA